ncbi:hypothetical protein M0805_005447 [Coniferiporia weirii]|nr:hypothetical protein M0805_005447 [Coniferiporia weirii]
MHSSYGRSRRNQRHDDEDALLTVSRGDDRRSESYSRSHQHSSRAEPYTGSSTSQRTYPISSSNNHRSEEWRVAETTHSSSNHDRYHSDNYNQSRRDSYYERSENWSGRHSENARYSSTSRDWTKRDDHGHNTTSYSENRVWSTTSRYEESSRNGNGLDDWPRDEARPERERVRYGRDETHSNQNQEHGWRAKEDTWTEDSTRDRKALNWNERTDDQRQWRTSNHDRERGRDSDRGQDRPHGVDRQWEPAATWKYKERDDSHLQRQDRTEFQQPISRYNNKKAAKNKKKAQLANLKRDGRREDNMNNWQRRDPRPVNRDKDYTKASVGKRRHAHSPESRSRSPAQSLSPKRRKRIDEPVDRKESVSSAAGFREAGPYRDEHEVMPPPAAPLPTSSSDAKLAVQTSPGMSVEAQAKGVRRNAGFRPIGFSQSSASIKRFFPDEDEDSDSSIQRSLQDGSRRPLSPPGRTEYDENARAERSPNSTPRQDSQIAPVNGTRSTNELISREGSLQPSRLSDIPIADSALPSPSARQGEEGREKQRHAETPKDQLYAIVSQVGEGTFGKVYKARNTVSGVHVALKRIRMEAERDGFPVTAMREIKLLQSLRHANIVQLMEMMVHHGSVYMVFEYMDHDLTGVLSQTQFAFTDAHLKSLCKQMLQGLSYLHRKGVIHRDIKGSNILLNNRGELKLADFGLARFYQKRRRADYTNRVITLWYRPPELLLGTTVYGPEVDMWSAGCIMLELFCKKPVFQGNDEIHQLDVVYKILGTPTPEEWPDLTNMPWYELVKPKEMIRNRFRELFQKWLSPAGLDLAERLLSYDPSRRATADQALEAPYFSQEDPPPMLPVGLSSLEGEWHEFESKRERAKKRRKVEG